MLVIRDKNCFLGSFMNGARNLAVGVGGSKGSNGRYREGEKEKARHQTFFDLDEEARGKNR